MGAEFPELTPQDSFVSKYSESHVYYSLLPTSVSSSEKPGLISPSVLRPFCSMGFQTLVPIPRVISAAYTDAWCDLGHVHWCLV